MGKMNKLSIVITNIQRALGSGKPLLVEITIFDQLGAKQAMQLIPASMCIGNLEKGQILVLAPKDQVSIKETM